MGGQRQVTDKKNRIRQACRLKVGKTKMPGSKQDSTWGEGAAFRP